jgi:hypothetical protein
MQTRDSLLSSGLSLPIAPILVPDHFLNCMGSHYDGLILLWGAGFCCGPVVYDPCLKVFFLL